MDTERLQELQAVGVAQDFRAHAAEKRQFRPLLTDDGHALGKPAGSVEWHAATGCRCTRLSAGIPLPVYAAAVASAVATLSVIGCPQNCLHRIP